MGVVSDFSSEYTMLNSSSSHRYQQHSGGGVVIVPSSAGSSGVSPGGASSTGSIDQHHLHHAHYASNNLQSNGGISSNASTPTGSTISSGQLFHPHHAIGHFSSPSATYIPTGYVISPLFELAVISTTSSQRVIIFIFSSTDNDYLLSKLKASKGSL